MRILTIIPTYNEIENIESLLTTILKLVPKECEVLVVDDGSPDGTGKVVESMCLKQSSPARIHILHREKKLGLGTAYITGFRWGLERGFDACTEMDADFSHDPKYLPTLYSYLKEYDAVIGSRYVPGGGTRNWGLGRRFLSLGGSFYARTILGVEVRDLTGGFNGWSRKVLETIGLESLKSDGYSFQIELKYRALKKGYRIKEFPIIFEDRKVGKSKMSKKIVFEALKRVWQFRFGILPNL